MEFDKILKKIFNKRCYINKKSNKKYFSEDDYEELYYVECHGFIKKTDLIENSLLKRDTTNVYLVNKIYIV